MPVATLITSSAEAEGLIRWSMLFALAYEKARLVVFYPPSMTEEVVQGHIDLWKTEGHDVVPELQFLPIDASPDRDAVLEQIDKNGISLLMVGQNRSDDSDPEIRRLCRELFDLAPCNAVAIRLGARRLEECDAVLIPSSGGPHSKVALRLGSRVAKRFKGKITALFIELGIGDEDGKAVGMRILNRVLDDAGIDRLEKEHVAQEVVVADKVLEGLREAASAGSYDLILIGASNSTTVKRKLFGSVPDGLLEGEEASTIAVIRKQRSMHHRLKQRLERFMTLRIPQLTREERIELFEKLQTNSRWSFDFLALMALATGIASLGLIQDSAAVVIGAMLVAPLMTPLLGSGLALVQGNLPLMRTCLRAIVLGFLAALAIGTLMGFLAPLSTLTSELASRGGPNLLDFGVAALSGIAASYCIARPGLSSALAGVAIAAALVPPIATVGISLALQEWSNASGAALLFATNVVAIILASALNFFANGVRGQGTGNGSLWVRRTVICLFISVSILIVPLTSVLISKKSSSREDLKSALIANLQEAGFPTTEDDVTVEKVDREGKWIHVVYRIIADEMPDLEVANKTARSIEKQPDISEADIEIVTDLRISSSSTKTKAAN